MILQNLHNLPNKIQWGGCGEFKHLEGPVLTPFCIPKSSIKQPVLLFDADFLNTNRSYALNIYLGHLRY